MDKYIDENESVRIAKSYHFSSVSLGLIVRSNYLHEYL